MKIVLFAGTTEGRQLALALDRPRIQLTVCVATGYGAALLPGLEYAQLRTGRLDAEGIFELIEGADVVIDATHPYADEVSRNIARAAVRRRVQLLRAARAGSDLAGLQTLPDAAAAAREARRGPGNILLTTGAKELPAFGDLPRERLYVRVLPSVESISACLAAQIPQGHIIAMQGPFGIALNEAILRQYNIAQLVTKDGGRAGGFEEKIAAARNAGVRVLVIRRPEQTPGLTTEQILKELGL